MKFDVTRVKIRVTVPTKDTDKVRDAICNAGAGTIGEYTYCSSIYRSLGTFIPSDKAHPHIGIRNKLSRVKEDMLEVVCDVDNVKRVLDALRKAHPYEEPAIDVVPLIDERDL